MNSLRIAFAAAVTRLPVGANGEKQAELAAPTTMRVMQKADILTWPAMAMVMGASRATPAMLPGPMVPS